MSVNPYDTISKYNAIKANLESVVNRLTLASDKLSSVPNTISNAYSIDDFPTPIVSRCKNTKNEIVNTRNYIVKVIIPAIDKEISKIRRGIVK